MRRGTNPLRAIALTAVALVGGAVNAALPVDLEVAVVQAAPLGAMQEWGKLLNDLGLVRVRLRGAHAGDKPSITPVGMGDEQRFRVLAILNDRDQLILRGGAFGRGDLAKLKQFLEGLPEQVAEEGVERGIFKLTKPQFEEVYKSLSPVFDGTTKGLRPDLAVAALAHEMRVPLVIDEPTKAALVRAQPLATELKGTSLGTALAMALRSAGLAMRPEQPRGGALVLRVGAIDPQKEAWPAGWKPEETAGKLAPAMYRFTTVEINGYSLAQALEALTPHMGVPLVFDERVIGPQGVDLAKVQVKFPKGKTYIRRAVDYILSQAHLKGELRLDEAGKPFYWITKYGADSLPATRQ